MNDIQNDGKTKINFWLSVDLYNRFKQSVQYNGQSISQAIRGLMINYCRETARDMQLDKAFKGVGMRKFAFKKDGEYVASI